MSILCREKILKGFNDFESLYPDIAQEWDYDKNGSLSPDNVTKGSNKIVWWKCRKCSNEWKATISSRASGWGCLLCGRAMTAQKRSKAETGINDFATLYPELAQEWNYEKNGDLRPEDVLPGSNKKVWWKCKKCGHEWQTTVNSRSSGTGCHICNRIYGKMSHKCKNLDTGEVFATLKEAAVTYGITGTTGISLCCSGKQDTAGGYHWQYIE